jgi:cytosol alanyl aminopeptidase
VDVKLRCEAEGGARLEVSQQRFKPKGADGAGGAWVLPACFRYASGGQHYKQCAEIGGPQSIALPQARGCPDWVVGNADGAGHWLARYEPAMLRALQSKVPGLPVPEAVALSFDTSLLLSTGHLPRARALGFVEAFLRHPSPGVKQGGIELLIKQQDAWFDAAQRKRLHALRVKRVVPLANSLGWLERPADGIGEIDLRAAVVPYAAQHAGGEKLRAQARALALRWIADPAALPATSAALVLTTAARFADSALFDKLWAAYHASRDRSDRVLLLKALATVRDPALRTRALRATLEAQGGAGPLEGRDAYTFIDQALEDDHNRVAAFQFLRENYDALVARMPADTARRLMAPLRDLWTPEDRDAFVAFFRDRAPAMAGGPKAYAQSLESIELHIAALR